ncbi:hypothetical protein, partial [Paracoccus sp. (in: a-proteobacteria)]|uniref:hypothetical protein n=1 Tax=Paracoccus sp. TaxID=267 RepID=UPI0026E02CF2
PNFFQRPITEATSHQGNQSSDPRRLGEGVSKRQRSAVQEKNDRNMKENGKGLILLWLYTPQNTPRAIKLS